MDDDAVILELGEGTARTQRFIREEVRSRFTGAALAPLEDSSWMPNGGSPLVVTTDSYIVEPPVFPGGDIGKLAVAGTVNDLVASGAAPSFMTLGLVLGEGVSMAMVRAVLDSVAREASIAGIEVVAGDTKVLPRRAAVEIIMSVTGGGLPVHSDRSYPVSAAEPGDLVLVTGSVGDHGLAVLSAREGLGFESVVRSDCAPLSPLLVPVLAGCPGVRCLRDPTRGGLLGALADIAESSHVEVVLEIASVPVGRHVRAGCEMLGVDPFLLVNEGKMVIVVRPDDAASIMARLRDHPLGRQAAVIGDIRPVRSTGAMVVLRDKGVERVFKRPEGAPLPRLC